MTSHRPPVPERNPRLWWPLMVAAVAGVAVPPVVWSAQHFAPHPAAAQTFTIPPEQVAEPSAHGGPRGPLALPSIGVVATGTTETTANRSETPHTVLGPTLRVIATPETGSQALSGALVATAGPSTTTDPQPSATVQAATTTAPPVTTAPATTPDPVPTTAATTTETSEPTDSETAVPATETPVVTP